MHDQDLVLGPVFLEFIPRPGSEQNGVSFFHLERTALAIFAELARPDSKHLALLRLVLGAIGQVDAALALVLRLLAPDDDPVSQWRQFHRNLPRKCGLRPESGNSFPARD